MPRAAPDSGLGEWRESVEAIRRAEHFPSLSEKNLAKIFAKAQPHGLTDEELAAVVRLDGAELRQAHQKFRNPLVWGYELIDCAVRKKIARRKETQRAPEPRPREQAFEESPVEPTGKVRVSSKGPCRKHRHPVVWVSDKGEELCVYCSPPDDDKVRAEACQMVRELLEEEERLKGLGT